MPLAKRKSTRTSIRREVEDALHNENDPKNILRTIRKARKKIAYTNSVRALERKYFDLTLPKAKKRDVRYISLRDCWIEASIQLRKYILIPATELRLKKDGYLKTMLNNLKIESIGEKNYKKLRTEKATVLTSEYLIFNFFYDHLSDEQREAIVLQLKKDGCCFASVDFVYAYKAKVLHKIKM